VRDRRSSRSAALGTLLVATFWLAPTQPALADFAANMAKVRKAVLKEAVRTLKDEIPTYYEDGVVLVDAHEDGQTLTLQYQMLYIRRADIDEQRWIHEVKQGILEEVCAPTTPILVVGARITYRYVDIDNAALGEVTVTKSDCPRKR